MCRESLSDPSIWGRSDLAGRRTCCRLARTQSSSGEEEGGSATVSWRFIFRRLPRQPSIRRYHLLCGRRSFKLRAVFLPCLSSHLRGLGTKFLRKRGTASGLEALPFALVIVWVRYGCFSLAPAALHEASKELLWRLDEHARPMQCGANGQPYRQSKK